MIIGRVKLCCSTIYIHFPFSKKYNIDNLICTCAIFVKTPRSNILDFRPDISIVLYVYTCLTYIKSIYTKSLSICLSMLNR